MKKEMKIMEIINQRELNKEKLKKVADELIKVARDNELTIIEFEQATYEVRTYFNQNAVLKTDNKE